MDLSGAWSQIEAAAKSMASVRENDRVGNDGLLVCGKCGGKKEFRGVFLGQERTLPCVCACREAELAEQRTQAAKEKAQKAVEHFRRIAFTDATLRTMTFVNDDGANGKVSDAAKRYVAAFGKMKKAGKGLIFHGANGTGKTYAAACIVNALLDQGVPCLMTSFARILNGLWSVEDRQEYLDSLNRFDLLVIDDLGAERQSEYVAENVFNVIDSRYRARLPLIVTTNLTLQELMTNETNRRIYDRVLEVCYPIEISGDSRRKIKRRQDFAEMKKILGM